MRFILDPDSPKEKYWLRRASLDKIFKLAILSPLDASRAEKALEFLKNNYLTTDIHAPFIPAFYSDLPVLKFEGKHRLHALKTLGCKEIAIGVPKKLNLSTLEFLL